MKDACDSFLAGRPWLRALLVWASCAFVLALIAGERRFDWSHNDHFAHLAKDLHAGHWTHPAPPPGFCSIKAKRDKKCRYHQFDDWAQAQSLVLDPDLAKELGLAPKVWAMSCRTEACNHDPKLAAHRWWIPGRGLTRLPSGRYRKGSQTWFVSFPPGPALWFLISLWLGLPMLPDIPLTWILAATIPATTGLALRGRWPELSATWALGLGVACLFASALVGIAVQGQVWFLAQVSFTALLSAGLAAWFCKGAKTRWLAGICWGLALACRPSALLGIMAAAMILVRRHRAQGRPSSFDGGSLFLIAGPLIALSAIAFWNWHRFGSVTEFGHHFLEIRWMQRIQERGMFDTSYLSRNLMSFFALPPRTVRPFTLPIHGLGWLWSTPWLLWLTARRSNDWPLLACTSLGIAPALLYQNTGQLQVSYRFALDLLPLWTLAIAPNVVGRRRGFLGLAGYSLLLHVFLAWAWVHHPAQIFGTRPSAWPFS